MAKTYSNRSKQKEIDYMERKIKKNRTLRDICFIPITSGIIMAGIGLGILHYSLPEKPEILKEMNRAEYSITILENEKSALEKITKLPYQNSAIKKLSKITNQEYKIHSNRIDTTIESIKSDIKEMKNNPEYREYANNVKNAKSKTFNFLTPGLLLFLIGAKFGDRYDDKMHDSSKKLRTQIY